MDLRGLSEDSFNLLYVNGVRTSLETRIWISTAS
jgi:hypothetical protein